MPQKKRNIKRNVGSEPGEKQPLGLRVIGGKFRGSKLKYSGDNRVRPMKDRTREAVFNLISTDSKGAHVIDLFAGTGALAIEAISRGATGATVIEVHLQTMRNMKLNLEALDLLKLCRLVQSDAFYFIKTLEADFCPKNEHWLVFCSPPYDFYVNKQQQDMIQMLQRIYEHAPPGSLLVVEADTRFDFDLLSFPDVDARFRTYMPAKIGIYRKPKSETEP